MPTQLTVQDCIERTRRAVSNNGGSITRDLLRSLTGEDAVPEKQWRRFFPTFKALLGAAVGVYDTDGKEEIVFTDDKLIVSFSKTTIHTLEELLEYCKVDLSIYEVERFVVNKWQMGYATGPKDDRVAKTEDLYQVKATLIKRKEVVDAREEIEKLKAEFKRNAPAYTPIYKVRNYKTGNMLEVNIPDSHFGRMVWSKETGGRPYDTPIAAETFLRALTNLITLSKSFKYDKVLFVVGNDLLNSDDELGRTSKGTFVSTDCRYQKTFGVVRKTITKSIEMLREIAPVEVILVSGNHDNLGVWHLGDSLECWFSNYDDVTIRNEPTSRKYVRFGDVFLLFTHGEKGKREDYPLVMATERSRDFGETKYREVHTGHIHQTKLQEWHGVRVRILPSLSPPDAWHSENNFIGQQRNAEAYVWNNKHGLVAMYFHNDDSYPEIVTDRVINTGE